MVRCKREDQGRMTVAPLGHGPCKSGYGAAKKWPRTKAISSYSAARVRPNHSLNPRLATAGVVSPACASRTIVAVRAYATCLRSRG